jgi:hypothetical protein
VSRTGTADAVRRLLREARELYGDDPDVAPVLDDLRQRLDEPLRVAIVGRVKAGKSTLLNALVGERLAPTDAGECTRVVTLYRHGAVPRVVLQDAAGAQRVLPVHRVEGALQLDLEGTPAEEVEQLVVDWPAPGLAEAVLVDTPGISSLSADASGRTQAFLEAGHRMPGADAVVFLTRQVQPEDLAFLASFQAGTGAAGVHTTTLTVLSRADEAGRLDALVAARGLAGRLAEDPAVRAVSQAVVPVAGLLALGGRLMRHRDFVALHTLATADPADVETMLLSADRFVRPEAPVPVSLPLRQALLERFGLFGVRLSIALIRTGVDDAPGLAEELVRRSGLAELRRLVSVHFTRRGEQLKAATALSRLEELLRGAPREGTPALLGEVELVRLSAHDLAELELLARLRGPDGPLPAQLRTEAEQILGGGGPSAADRLGLAAGAPVEEVRAAAAEAAARWRTAAEDPFADRPAVEAMELVARSCEELLAELEAGRSAGAA